MVIKEEIKNMCNTIIAEHMKEIPYKVEFTNRGTNYLGKCICKRGGSYILRFSTLFFNTLYELGDIAEIKDVILHEIAHALCKEIHGSGHHHDYYWRKVAMSIGCNGNRCSKTNITMYKYVYECINCGRRIYRLRPFNGRYSCGECDRKYSNGKFTEAHLYKLVESHKEVQIKTK